MERSLNLYIDAGTPYTQEYLGLLARTGKLEARKRGRVWVTTRRAVAAYRRSVES